MQAVSRVARKKAATKEKIFQAAMELFLEHGYDKTTVEQIAEKADVAKGTFFNYFPTKDEVLYYLGDYRMAVMEQMLADELKDIKSAKEKLYACLRFFCKENEKYKSITALICKTIIKSILLDKNCEADINSNTQFKNRLVHIITEGQKLGEFRKNVNPVHSADLLFANYFFTLFDWFENKLEGSLEDETIARVDLIMKGIC